MKEPVAVRVLESSSSPSPQKIARDVRRNHASMCSSAQLIIQNLTIFKASAAPVRCLFYHGGSWVDFQSDVVESWRSAFHEEKPMIEATIGGGKYLSDFLRMIPIDLESGQHRSIASINVNGKPFFPKVFVDEDFMEEQESSGYPKLKTEIRIDGLDDDDGKRKNKKHENELGVDLDRLKFLELAQCEVVE